jgi:hypothetical protein
VEKNNNIIVVVMILCIISQIVSYVAIDKILSRVMTPAQIYVTVSDNSIEDDAKIEAELGQIEAEMNEMVEISSEEIEAEYEAIKNEFKPQGVLTQASGVNYFDGHKETYYNLPMDMVVQIAHQRGIEGEYWVREDGVKMLGDYVMCATRQDLYGQVVETSLGMGISVDTGTFAFTNPDQVDIAVNW